MKKNEWTLGIDCGGTNIKMAFVDKAGGIAHSRLEPVDFKDSPESVIRSIGRKIKSFADASGIRTFKSVGMGIAGDCDQKNGVVRYSPNLNWKNVPLKKILSREIGAPVLVENDANCAAWGAYCLDARRDCENLVCVTMGTGIGGGIILGGKLYRGAVGSAGEIGHMTIQYDGRQCKCGNYGCLESLIGAWGLIRRAEEGLHRGRAPKLKKLLQASPKKKIDPKMMADAARAGDPFCVQLWKDAGEQLGCALVNFVNVFNPDRIVLCGGVSKAGDLILKPALHTLGARAFAAPAKHVRVTVSKYDERLGVVGAALLFWE